MFSKQILALETRILDLLELLPVNLRCFPNKPRLMGLLGGGGGGGGSVNFM